MPSSRFVGVIAILGSLVSCASASANSSYQPTPTSDVFLKVEDGAYAAKWVADLAARAQFELDCPADQLTYKKLGTVLSIGVTGCGKKAVYKLVTAGYALNSDVTATQ